MSNVYEKLQQARANLQAKNLKKTGKNKFSGFSYYELADFLPAINLIFNELKLCSNFSICGDVAKLDIINSEKPDELISFLTPTAALEPSKGRSAIQAVGGLHTYCRRYLYMNALEIVENDFIDAADNRPVEKPEQPHLKVVEPVTDDVDLYQKVADCNSITELYALYNAESKNVQDLETFKNICSSRKEVLKQVEERSIQ